MAPKLKLRQTIRPKFVQECLNLKMKDRNTNEADEIKKEYGGMLELTIADKVESVVVPLLLVVLELEFVKMQENDVEL